MRPLFAAAIVVASAPQVLAAPIPPSLRATGVWRSGDGTKQVLVAGRTASEFIEKAREMSQQGMAPSQIATYRWNGQDHYTTLFEPDADAKSVTRLLGGTWQRFVELDKELFDKGYRVADIALGIDPKDARKVSYTALWKKGLGSDKQLTDPAATWDAFAATGTKRFQAGMRLVAMASVSVLDDVQAGTRRAMFVGTWRAGQGNDALYLIPPRSGSEYASAQSTFAKEGLRPVATGTYTLNGSTPVYAGAVSGGTAASAGYSSPAIKWSDLFAEHKKRVADGYKMVDLSLFTQFTKLD